MTLNLPEEFASFRSELDKLPPFWSSIDLRTVATFIDGAWHNLGTRVYLDPRAADQVTRFPQLPKADHLLILQEVREAVDLDSLLASVASGRGDIGGQSVRFEVLADDAGAVQPYRWGVGFSDIAGGNARDYVHWSALQAWGHGSALANLVGAGGLSRDRIDAAIRLGAAPYDGLADLERYFLAKPQPAQGNTAVAFEVFAPIQVLIERRRTRLENGKLTVHIRSTSRAFLEECSLGFFGLDATELPLQGSIRPEEIHQEKAPQTWVAVVTADVGETYFAKLMLRVGAWCVDRAVLHDLHRPGRNQRQLAYEVMDPGEELFQKWLFPEAPDQDDQFERAVARLFMMLGYQVDSYAGVRQLGEGVDLLAHEPLRPVLLAVECTTGTPGSGGKLGRLVARTRALSRALGEVEVLSVLVTSLPLENIPKDQQGGAAADGVALVSRDGVAQLLRALSASVPVDGVTSLIRGMVPPGRTAVWG